MIYLLIPKLAPIVAWIIVEALPQSITQLIAIVYYQDTEIVSVISVCISLASVLIATKTMVFSMGIDFCVFIFN